MCILLSPISVSNNINHSYVLVACNISRHTYIVTVVVLLYMLKMRLVIVVDHRNGWWQCCL